MKDQFEYMIEEIREWIESGRYEHEPSASFDERSGMTIVDYVDAYLTDEEDEHGSYIQIEIPLTLYIHSDHRFQIELNKSLFEFYYKGYETPEVLEIVEGFMKYAGERNINP